MKQKDEGLIEIGDVIVNPLTHIQYSVHRVSNKFAFVWFNENYEAKFQRKFYHHTIQIPKIKHASLWPVFYKNNNI